MDGWLIDVSTDTHILPPPPLPPPPPHPPFLYLVEQPEVLSQDALEVRDEERLDAGDHGQGLDARSGLHLGLCVCVCVCVCVWSESDGEGNDFVVLLGGLGE